MSPGAQSSRWPGLGAVRAWGPRCGCGGQRVGMMLRCGAAFSGAGWVEWRAVFYRRVGRSGCRRFRFNCAGADGWRWWMEGRHPPYGGGCHPGWAVSRRVDNAELVHRGFGDALHPLCAAVPDRWVCGAGRVERREVFLIVERVVVDVGAFVRLRGC